MVTNAKTNIIIRGQNSSAVSVLNSRLKLAAVSNPSISGALKFHMSMISSEA